MKKGMKATSLRNILAFLLVLTILGAAAGFYFGVQQIRSYSVEVAHTSADANASAAAVDELQKLKQALSERETLVTKANQVFTTEANYQSQALKDVQRYAASAGLTISNTNFEINATGITIAGKPFGITLQSPLSYKKLIQFLNAIEGNIPKMQVASIEVSRPTENNPDQVIISEIIIVVSTR